MVGSSSDSGVNFPNSSTTTLKTEYFKWNTESGEQPFEVKSIVLTALESLLNDEKVGAGVTNMLQDRLLKNAY